MTVSDGSSSAEAKSIFISGNNVYVAGYEFSATNNIAEYWKNGTAFSLIESGSFPAGANAIVAAGKDIYAAGYEYNETGRVARYWKNGISVPLGGIASYLNSTANSVAVVGKDVYVAGAGGENPDFYYMTAQYWKNGFPIKLSSYGFGSIATSIAVSGDDIYVVGTYRSSNSVESGPTLWINGEIYILPGQSAGALGIANSVFISKRNSNPYAGKY